MSIPCLTTVPSAIAVATLAATLTGCKIQLSASPGGAITTLSGTYSCGGGESCPDVPVVDLFFDETFVAEAEEGFEFAGWKRRDRGLCGGSKTDCRLFTSGFAGNDALLAFLNNDEVFFLEAVFSEVDASGSGTGDASDCWNRTLNLPGTRQTSEYRVSETLQGSFSVFYDGVVEGGVTFNGLSARRLSLNVESTQNPSVTATTRAYFQVPTAEVIRDLGTETESTEPSLGTAVNTNDPYRLLRFNLAAGESYTQTYTTTLETMLDGAVQVISRTQETTRTFDGIEEVTVPAGTYQACRFTDVTVSDGSTDTTREWVDVESGVLLKASGDAQTSELVSMTVNGEEI